MRKTKNVENFLTIVIIVCTVIMLACRVNHIITYDAMSVIVLSTASIAQLVALMVYLYIVAKRRNLELREAIKGYEEARADFVAKFKELE